MIIKGDRYRTRPSLCVQVFDAREENQASGDSGRAKYFSDVANRSSNVAETPPVRDMH